MPVPTPDVRIGQDQNHLAWDPAIPPVATVPSGSVIEFDCLDASFGQLTASSTTADIATLDFARVDQVNGPVAVEGAEPGGTLQIDLLDFSPADWGWTASIPGFGLLADEFPDPFYKATTLPAGADRVEYWPGIRIPLAPFCGEVGVAPGDGPLSTIPPDLHGGNMDTRHLVAGTTLYLPVFVPGANLSMGDGHATQGDGEVCGTAIETPMRATVRVTARNDLHVTGPEFEAAADPMGRPAPGTAVCHRRHRSGPHDGRPRRDPADDRVARPRARPRAGPGLPAVQRGGGPADQRDRRRAELDRDRPLPAGHLRLGVPIPMRMGRRVAPAHRSVWEVGQSAGACGAGSGRVSVSP